MRTKKVNRYWCDYCNKAGLSAGHMAKHERHCTLNPNRICRVCPLVEPEWTNDFKPAPLAELVKLLPVPVAYKNEWGGVDYQSGFQAEVMAAVPILRTAAGDCPACMMAALRQAKIPVPLAEGFSFSERMQNLWSTINEGNREACY